MEPSRYRSHFNAIFGPPSRTIFVVGETGVGKTSLCRALSVTASTNASEQKLAKSLYQPNHTPQAGTIKPIEISITTTDGTLRVIDTPGLNDGDGRDQEFLTEITGLMKNIQDCSAIVLIFKYGSNRFTASMQRMVTLFHEILGDLLMPLLVIVFTGARDEEVAKYRRDTASLVSAVQRHVAGTKSFSGLVPSFLIDTDMDEDEPFPHQKVIVAMNALFFQNPARSCKKALDVMTSAIKEKQQIEELTKYLKQIELQTQEAARKAKEDEERREQQRKALEEQQRQQQRGSAYSSLFPWGHVKSNTYYSPPASTHTTYAAAPQQSYYSTSKSSSSSRGRRVYISDRGACYHLSEACSNYGNTVTESKAKSMGKRPCSKCAD